MYSLGTSIAMNNRVTGEAIRKGKLPQIIRRPEELDTMTPFPFPSIGNYEPEGWTPLDIWFVDSTGGGRGSEPALTLDAFKRAMKECLAEHGGFQEGKPIGFAIIEEGEMQVHVQAFRKDC